VVSDTTPPAVPTVDGVNDQSTEVTGTTEANAEVTVKVGDDVIGSGTADGEGKFSITIAAQTASTTLTVTAKDEAGNESTSEVVILTSYATVKIQLNGNDFAQSGYAIDGHTYVNWNTLKELSIPYTDNGNGIFVVEGRNVQAESVNGDWYIKWSQLSPGKVKAVKISGGYNFIYTNLKIQLNGNDFTQGGYAINGHTHLNCNALKTLGIPYTDNGNGIFVVEGHNVQAESVNGDWYIKWSQLSPGKVKAVKISGGYNFIYTNLKIQLNGNDFTQGGYAINGHTHLNWNALKTLGVPYTDNGNGLFVIEGQNVQAESVNGDWYIKWSQLSPGKINAVKISGGYNFIYTNLKIQLNGNNFAQGGYAINRHTHLNWNALKTLGIPYTDNGNGLFVIEGRNVQAESVNGDWYIKWSQLSPGKINAVRIGGGYNFIYNPGS
jgi:hypothetical protein